jgi:hypothetical protein
MFGPPDRRSSTVSLSFFFFFSSTNIFYKDFLLKLQLFQHFSFLGFRSLSFLARAESLKDWQKKKWVISLKYCGLNWSDAGRGRGPFG